MDRHSDSARPLCGDRNADLVPKTLDLVRFRHPGPPPHERLSPFANPQPEEPLFHVTTFLEKCVEEEEEAEEAKEATAAV